jgi:hypothetical protein
VKLAFYLMTIEDPAAARDELELALAVLDREPPPDPMHLALATQRLATVEAQLGNLPRARIASERAIQLYDSMDAYGRDFASARDTLAWATKDGRE